MYLQCILRHILDSYSYDLSYIKDTIVSYVMSTTWERYLATHDTDTKDIDQSSHKIEGEVRNRNWLSANNN